MKKAVYAGSFDPLTLGHLSVLEKGTRLFDEVIVVVGKNTQKKSFFAAEERKHLIEASLQSVDFSDRVRVEVHEGLLADFCRANKVQFLLRGIRAVSDYEHEMQSACMNRSLMKGLEAFLVIADDRYHFVSSSLVKEVASMGQDVTEYVPAVVAEALRKKLSAQ